ncbi:MAG: hypothetical protein HY547_07840, partial [Elusimicrobia bacterium]|nr:hypothetical protein [Elusimicrobiota bacterium]
MAAGIMAVAAHAHAAFGGATNLTLSLTAVNSTSITANWTFIPGLQLLFVRTNMVGSVVQSSGVLSGPTTTHTGLTAGTGYAFKIKVATETDTSYTLMTNTISTQTKSVDGNSSTFTISGYARDSSNQGISGVTVRLTSMTLNFQESPGTYGVYTTTGSGYYQFVSISTSARYRAYFVKSGLTFMPDYTMFSYGGADITNYNTTGSTFTASAFQLSSTMWDWVGTTTTLKDGNTIQTYTSTSSSFMDFGGISFYLPPNASLDVDSRDYGLMLGSDISTSVTFGSKLSLSLGAGVDALVSTTSSGAYMFLSTQASNLTFGDAIKFQVPAGKNMYVTEKSGGVLMKSTEAATVPYGNFLKLNTLANIAMDISTNAAFFSGGWIFNSTAATKMKAGGDKIECVLPADLKMDVQEKSNGMVLRSTTAATMDYGKSMKFALGANTTMDITTSAFFTNGWVFDSTAATTMKAGGDKISFVIPPSLQMNMEEKPDGVIVRSTGAIAVSYGNNLKVNLSSDTNVDIATSPAFGDGWTFASTATCRLKFGTNSILLDIPAGIPTDLKEDSDGVVIRSTSNAPVVFGGSVEMRMPPNVNADLTNHENENLLDFVSTVTVPLGNSGVTVSPSTGTVQAEILGNTFSVSMQTGSIQECNLALPTTAQKSVEIKLNSPVVAEGAVKTHFEPGALSAQVDLEVKIPESLPSAIASSSNDEMIHITSNAAVEINPSQGVTIANSTGVAIVMNYQDSNLEGSSTEQLRICVYSTGTARWEIIPSIVNVASKTVTAYAPHFSTYKLQKLGNKLNQLKLGTGPLSTPLWDFLKTSSTLLGGSTVYSYSSTAPVKLDFGGIGFNLGANTSMGVIPQSGKIVLQSSNSAPVTFGSNMNFQVPANVGVSVATTASGAFVFNSTATQSAMSIGGGRINFKLEPGKDTFVRERSDGIVLKTTASAKMDFGSYLKIQTPAFTDVQISTGSSAFATGSVFLSTAQFSLTVGSGSLAVPASLPLDLMERASGDVALRSTMTASLNYGGSIRLALPPNIQADLKSKESGFVLFSTAAVPLVSAGASFQISSGTMESFDLANLFKVALGTDTAANCALHLPTTAQKTVEVQLTQRDSSTGTVSVKIAPDALSANVDLTVKFPADIPSSTRTAGGKVTALGGDMAVEINPSGPVSIDNSTGVPIVFTYTDADLAGGTTASFKVCVYSTPTATWEIVNTVIDSQAKTITAYAPHFSLYQAMSFHGETNLNPIWTSRSSVTLAAAWNNAGANWIAAFSLGGTVVSSGTVAANSTSYANLNAATSYSFKVKIATETDSAYVNNTISTTTFAPPAPPASFAIVHSTIAAGTHHTCARLADNTVKCWGRNDVGQLGLGTTVYYGDNSGEMGDSLPPVSLGAGRTAQGLATGIMHTCALLDDNTVKCWGYNALGSLGLGDIVNRGDNANEMGDSLPVVSLGAGRTAKALVVGLYHTCALLDDNSVKCWGYNNYGQLGLGDTVTRGDAANEMGDNLPTVNLGAGRTAKALVADIYHTCALLDDNTVKCWGYNSNGQLGLGDMANRGDGANEMGDNLPAVSLGAGRTAKALAAGEYHTCALLDDNTVKCWGRASLGQLGLGDIVFRGDDASEMGDSLPAVSLGTGRTAKAISGGSYFTCALLDDNTVKCWGHNAYGQLGLGDIANRGDGASEMGDSLPAVSLGAGRTAKDLSAGGNHACVLLDNNAIKCWGRNEYGQLGLGDTSSRGDAANEMGDNLSVVPTTGALPVPLSSTPLNPAWTSSSSTTLAASWGGAGSSWIAVLTQSGFTMPLSSGTVISNTTSYANLIPGTGYNFKVKIATEPDTSFTSNLISTMTLQTPTPP